MQENKITDIFLATINTNTKDSETCVEKKINGKGYVTYGESNKFPQYLYNLYSSSATLQSIINGTSDFVIGNDITCNIPNFNKSVNKKGETIRDIIAKISIDYCIFGAFSLQIIRNMIGEISEIYWLDVSKLRSDEKNEVFYYSEDWSKSYGRVKTLLYPKFSIEDTNATSIFYHKGNKARGTYGTPIWGAAVKNVEIDTAITDFHKNELANNFLGSKLINFANGMPDKELREEIENSINEKFTGTQNAGKIMISFSDGVTNAPKVLNLGTDDFDTRYETLERRNREQIFTAFRAVPALFGLMTESTGFNSQEFAESFKLYNRTCVQPIQKSIVETFDKIFGIEGSITIVPFSIEENKDNNVN